MRYKITIQRDGQQRPTTKETYDNLKDAQDRLLELFNIQFGTNHKNWGLAVASTKKDIDCANPTYPDGTRSFSYDVYKYRIEADED